jgi:hypothetical protein
MKKRTVINPRYPHIIKITRVVTKKVDVPVSEAIADIDEDDPLADQDAVDESTTEHTELTEEEVVLYDGKGRSYTDTTTTGNKVVDENKREASIPIRYDEWEAGKKPLDGDTIYATVGNNTEVGIVKDCEPDNGRTVIYWEFVRV